MINSTNLRFVHDISFTFLTHLFKFCWNKYVEIDESYVNMFIVMAMYQFVHLTLIWKLDLSNNH